MGIKFVTLLLVELILVGASFQASASSLEDGQGAVERSDYRLALQRLMPLARQGSAPAQYEVGRMYEMGSGVTKDYEAAASWYRKSSKGGDHRAQLLLALLYARGQGVPQDDKQGLFWLSKATDGSPPQKQAAAQKMYYLTSGSFESGKQLSRDDLSSRALPAMQARADRGDTHYKCALLQMYTTGQATPRKTDDVAALRRTCADAGHGWAGQPPPLPIPPARPHD